MKQLNSTLQQTQFVYYLSARNNSGNVLDIRYRCSKTYRLIGGSSQTGRGQPYTRWGGGGGPFIQ
jgi:hypothetical protein